MNIKNRLAIIEALKRLMGVEGPLEPEGEHALILLAYGASTFNILQTIENNEEFKQILTELLKEEPCSLEILKEIGNICNNLSYAIEAYLRKQVEGE